MKMNIIFIFSDQKNGKNNPEKSAIQRPAFPEQAPQPQGHFPLRQFRTVFTRAKTITPKTGTQTTMVERFSEKKAIIRLLRAADRPSGIGRTTP
jgi:hypothetical protein